MVQFTKQLSGLLIVGSIFLLACKSSETVPVEKLSADYVALQAGTSVQTATGLTVQADSVGVFLCPDNADCFAPNSARVSLRLSKSAQSQSVQLVAWIPNYTRRSINQAGFIDSTRVNLGGQQYKVILRDGRYTANSGSDRLPEAIVQVSPIE